MKYTQILSILLSALLLASCTAQPAESSSEIKEPTDSKITSPLPESGEADRFSYVFSTEDSYGRRPKTRGYFILQKSEDKITYSIWSGEKMSGGYGMEVIGIKEEDGILSVTIRETKPDPDSTVTMALTCPTLTLTLSPMPEEISFKTEDGQIYEPKEIEVKRALMTDGILYVDSGFQCAPIGRCGNMDGYPLIVIERDRMPENDGEANFETRGWQISGYENTIDVLIDGEFRIFAKEGTPIAEGTEIPDSVLRFTAVVDKVNDDHTITVLTDDNPSVYPVIQKNTRYILPLEAYDPGIYTDTPMAGNIVIIACGSPRTEENPIRIEEVYQISPMGSDYIHKIESE